MFLIKEVRRKPSNVYDKKMKEKNGRRKWEENTELTPWVASLTYSMTSHHGKKKKL